MAEVVYQCALSSWHGKKRFSSEPSSPPVCCGKPMLKMGVGAPQDALKTPVQSLFTKASVKNNKEVRLEDLLDEIKKRANEIYLKRGQGPGDELSDWLEAEREIKKKYRL